METAEDGDRLSQEARAVLDAMRNGKITVQTSEVWPTVVLPAEPSTIELFRALAEAVYVLDARLKKLEAALERRKE